MKTLNKILLSLLSSILMFFAFYPREISFLIFFALIPLLYIYRRTNTAEAFFYFTLSAVLFYVPQYLWLRMIWSWKVLAVMTAYLAFYTGLWGFLCKVLRIRFASIPEILAASFLFALLEIARGTLLGGYNGCSFSSALYRFLPFIQSADLGSMYFVSALIVCVNICLFSFFVEPASDKPQILSLLVLVFAGNMLYGAARLHMFRQNTVPVRFTLIQPCIEQHLKWNSDFLLRNLKKSADLISSADERTEIFLLPETATPNDMTKYPRTYETFSNASRGKFLLLGSEYFDFSYFYCYEHSRKKNAAFLLHKGRIIQSYFKLKPAPFAEYSPLRFLKKLVLGKGTEPSREYTIFNTVYASMGVNICLEAAYPELSRGFANNGADILINISNEAWFLDKPVSKEINALSVFRAVENRRDFIKVSNCGISFYADARGKIHFRTSLFVPEVKTFEAYPRCSKTLWQKFGYTPIWAGFIIFYLIFLLRKRKKVYYIR